MTLQQALNLKLNGFIAVSLTYINELGTHIFTKCIDEFLHESKEDKDLNKMLRESVIDIHENLLQNYYRFKNDLSGKLVIINCIQDI
jgi:hypothetical protein